MMKALRLLVLISCMLLTACEGWPARPYSYVPTPAAPSRTPSIRTPTPIILSPVVVTLTPSLTLTATSTEAGLSPTPTSTETPQAPTFTATLTPFAGAITVNILGCDTGVDVLHGMGEVTNAYVTISNSTAADVADVCATLRGLDEGRPHPDKTRCLPSLPSGYRVTLKLTVDTTYNEATPVQVDVVSGQTLLMRAGSPACTAIGLLLPAVSDLGLLQPIP